MVKKKKPTPIEKFLSLSNEEKAAEIAALEQFDREHPFPLTSADRLPGRAMTPAERRKWTNAKSKAGRGSPQIGQGSKIVPVSIERTLLKEADAFAREHKLKRSELVAQGIRLVMQRAKAG